MAAPSKKYRKGKPVELNSGFVDEVLKQYGLHEKIIVARINRDREAIFGPALAAHLTATDLDDGKLVLKIDNDAWRHELKLEEKKWIQSLNEATGGEIRKLFFV